jgi:hypothetical protein
MRRKWWRAISVLTTSPLTGLLSGLTISLFSKPLALLLGLAFLGLHTAEKQLGISIIPYNTIQKYVKGVDLRSAVQDNAALKVSFGVMFALSGFASFWRLRSLRPHERGWRLMGLRMWRRARAARNKAAVAVKEGKKE